MRPEASAPAPRPYTRSGPSLPSERVFGGGAHPGVGSPDRNGVRKYAPLSVTSLSVYGGTRLTPLPCAATTADVVIGTPGRLFDLAGSGHLEWGA